MRLSGPDAPPPAAGTIPKPRDDEDCCPFGGHQTEEAWTEKEPSRDPGEAVVRVAFAAHLLG